VRWVVPERRWWRREVGHQPVRAREELERGGRARRDGVAQRVLGRPALDVPGDEGRDEDVTRADGRDRLDLRGEDPETANLSPLAQPCEAPAFVCDQNVARAELGEYAPRIEMFKIPTDKIREVIGTGGKVIREIVEKTGAKVNIDDDGTVKVASADGESIKAAIKWIKSIASDPELGQIYDGTVVKVMDFGAFVNFFGAKDGLVHISQLAANRVQKTSDVVKEGDKVKVKLLGFDDRGKTRLSMKAVDQVTRARSCPVSSS